MVCAVEEIEKSTLFWGEGGKSDQDAQKFKCLNTFVAHCSIHVLSAHQSFRQKVLKILVESQTEP